MRDRLVLPGRRPSSDSRQETQQEPADRQAASTGSMPATGAAAAAAGRLTPAEAAAGELRDGSQPALPQGWGSGSAASSTADACLTGAAAEPKGSAPSAAGAGAVGQVSKAGASSPTSPVGGSWSAVSAQLAAELESELADLLTSAAARLDADMAAAYSTPEVRLPLTNSSGGSAAASQHAGSGGAGQPAEAWNGFHTAGADSKGGEKSGSAGAGSVV
ncbi:hypothetical protein COO60DRAFT_1506386 [Scenedesmus sp. NREL 46B-D3]|nr:hypothetical protein COO60DRAFT_1506386 [Scenedesmus sp. NREL 46B-D3]